MQQLPGALLVAAGESRAAAAPQRLQGHARAIRQQRSCIQPDILGLLWCLTYLFY